MHRSLLAALLCSAHVACLSGFETSPSFFVPDAGDDVGVAVDGMRDMPPKLEPRWCPVSFDRETLLGSDRLVAMCTVPDSNDLIIAYSRAGQLGLAALQTADQARRERWVTAPLEVLGEATIDLSCASASRCFLRRAETLVVLEDGRTLVPVSGDGLRSSEAILVTGPALQGARLGEGAPLGRTSSMLLAQGQALIELFDTRDADPASWPKRDLSPPQRDPIEAISCIESRCLALQQSPNIVRFLEAKLDSPPSRFAAVTPADALTAFVNVIDAAPLRRRGSSPDHHIVVFDSDRIWVVRQPGPPPQGDNNDDNNDDNNAPPMRITGEELLRLGEPVRKVLTSGGRAAVMGIEGRVALCLEGDCSRASSWRTLPQGEGVADIAWGGEDLYGLKRGKIERVSVQEDGCGQ